VLALDRSETLGMLPDEDVLELGVEQQRIVITHNLRHFAPIARRWAEGGHSHSGLILVTLPHTAYGAILRRLETAFAAHPCERDWVDRVEFV
jgi:Domain of unknown function (DUF5615)